MTAVTAVGADCHGWVFPEPPASRMMAVGSSSGVSVDEDICGRGAFQSSSDVARSPSRFCVPWADCAEHAPWRTTLPPRQRAVYRFTRPLLVYDFERPGH